MAFNKLIFSGLTIGCLAAAGGGAFLAVRQNQTAGAADAQVAPGGPAPVTESEGVIAPSGPTAVAPIPETAPRRTPSISSAPTAASRASSRPAPRAPIAESRPALPPPTTASSAPATSGGTMWESRPTVQPSVPDYKEAEAEAPALQPPPPPAPEFIEITVPPDAVLGLQIERTISSELARVEDKVEARVTRDVRVDGRIAIPAGSTVRGSVTEVDRGGRMKGKARLAIRFHTVVLADGTQLGLKTDPVIREGASPNGESAAKVGGAAIGGAILGAILGGGKGAAIGAGVGAAGGTAAAMANDRNPATLPAGTTVTVRMQAPVNVTVQKE